MREAGFGFGAIEFAHVVPVDDVDVGGEGGSEGHADANAEEGQAGDAGGPGAGLLEDKGVGGEV